MQRKVIGAKSDVLLEGNGWMQQKPIGCNDPLGKKALNETDLKLPKTLEDMLYALLNDCVPYPTRIRDLKTTSFILTRMNF